MAAAGQEDLMPVIPVMLGHVTYIVDPSEFWMRIVSEADQGKFRNLEQTLGNHAIQLPEGDVDTIAEDTIVLVDCPESSGSKRWKRAVVVRVDRQQNTFDVWYRDYGNTEIVPANRVRGNVPGDIQKYPATVYRCALAGIKPVASSWTSRGVKVFQKLVTKGPVKVALLIYDHDTLKLRVNMYPPGDSSQSVAHQMLENMCGLPTEEKIQEYLKDVILYSYEEVYGLKDSRPSGDSSMGEEATEKTEDAGQGWVTGAESSTGFQQNHLEDQQSDQTGNQSVASEVPAMEDSGQETVGDAQMDRDAEETEEHTDTASVVVPMFNLSPLQEQGTLTAEELQREQEGVQQSLRLARLAKDREQYNRDLDNMRMSSGPPDSWGPSDLQYVYGAHLAEEVRGFGTHVTSRSFGRGVHYSGVDTPDCTAQASSQSHRPGDKGLKQDRIPEDTSRPAEKSPVRRTIDEMHYDEGRFEMPSPFDTSAARKSPEKNVFSQEYGEEGGSLSPELGATAFDSEQYWTLQPPPEFHPSWTAEERRYRLQEYVKQALEGVVATDGVQMDGLYACIHCLAPLDAEHHESEIKNLLEVLLEEAVTNVYVRELALQVFYSYSGVLKGELLLNLLRYGAEKFVKLPVGKMPARWTDFVDVLTQLLYRALDWPVILQIVIRDFILSCLEKWIVFNKKGSQTSLMHHHVEELYMECAELLLPVSFSMLQAYEAERVVYIWDQMKEKVLETDVSYSIRSRLLNLLLRFPQPYSEAESSVQMPAPVDSRQADKPSHLRSHATSHLSLKRRVTTVDQGCQTESLESIGLLRKSSISSTDSFLGPGEIPVSGGSRRRRALLAHLNRQKGEGRGDSSVPDPGSADSSCNVSPDSGPQSDPLAQASLHNPSKTPAADQNKAGSTSATSREAAGNTSCLQSMSISTAKGPELSGATCQTAQSELSLRNEERDQCQHSNQATVQDVDAGKGESPDISQESSALFSHSAMSSISQTVFSNDRGGSGDVDPSSSLVKDSASSGDTSQQLSSNISDVGAVLQEDTSFWEQDSSVCISHDSKTPERHTDSEDENYYRRLHIEGDDDWGFRTDFKTSEQYSYGSGYSNPSYIGCMPDGVGFDDDDDDDGDFFSQSVSHENQRQSYSSVAGITVDRASKKKFNEEFPSLPSRPVEQPSRPVDSDSALTKGQLTLDSIACGFIQDHPKKKKTKKAKKTAQTKSSESAEPSFRDNEVYVSKDDERGSVPSDWESRAVSSPSFSTGERGAMAGTGKMGRGDDGCAGLDSQGDRRNKKSTASRKHKVDAAGDSYSSPLSSPYRNATSEDSGAAEASGVYARDTGLGLSPANNSGSESFSQGSSSPFTPSGGDSSGTGIPYQRGDLTRMFEGNRSAKRKGKKTTYRPFRLGQPLPVTSESLPTLDWWRVPCCTNCGDEGHRCHDCPKPRKLLD